MFCKKCGTQLDDDAVFCSGCGFKLGVSSENVSRPTNEFSSSRSGKTALICDMCHSNALVKEGEVYVCQACGTKYSVEEAKRLSVELKGPIRIDHSDEVTNLYTLARRCVDAGNFEMASTYYSQLIIKDPNNWEPNFYSVYCPALKFSINDIPVLANRIDKAEEIILGMLHSNVSDRIELRDTLSVITTRLIALSDSYYKALVNAFRPTYNSPSVQHVNQQAYQIFKSGSFANMNILYYLGDRIINEFGIDYAGFALDSWKHAINQATAFSAEANNFASKASNTGAPGLVKPIRTEAKTVTAVANTYNTKGASTSASYNVRRKEAIDAYWNDRVEIKAQLQQELGELQRDEMALTQKKSVVEKEIRSLNTKKLDPRILFNKDEKNIIQGKLDVATSEKTTTDNELVSAKKRIAEIMQELNKDRLFYVE